MKQTYVESILLIERLHRRFLDVVKTELERLKITDINNVQALILYNIGDEELTIGELTHRGYYLGSNVSYNVKKLVEKNFLVQVPAPHDRRSTRIRLSEKGLDLTKKVDALYERNINELNAGAEPGMQKIVDMNDTLHKLENFWSNYINNAHRL